MSWARQRSVRLFLALGVVLGVALTAPLARGASSSMCQLLFSDFWSQSEPVSIGLDAKGTPLFLTYSFDSEIAMDEMWGFVLKNATPRELARAKTNFNGIIPPLPRAELARIIGVSEKQFAAFYLRRDAGKSQAIYRFSDLNSVGIRQLYEKAGRDQGFRDRYTTGLAMPVLTDDFIPLVKRAGLDINASYDQSSPEMRHRSSEGRPAQYAQEIEVLHRLFPDAQTHFHLGVPAARISRREMVEIGRMIETKIILTRLAKATAYKDSGALKFGASTFDGDAGTIDAQRGQIKVEFDAFHEPFPAHDLEIRQSENVADGLDTLEVASHLVVTASPSLIRDAPLVVRSSDSRFGRVITALAYAALLIEKTPGGLDDANALRSLASEAGRMTPLGFTRHDLPAAYLAKLETFLNSRRIPERYRTALMSL